MKNINDRSLINPFATMCAYNAQNGDPGGGAPWRVPRGGTRRPTSQNERGVLPLSTGSEIRRICPVDFEKN